MQRMQQCDRDLMIYSGSETYYIKVSDTSRSEELWDASQHLSILTFRNPSIEASSWTVCKSQASTLTFPLIMSVDLLDSLLVIQAIQYSRCTCHLIPNIVRTD